MLIAEDKSGQRYSLFGKTEQLYKSMKVSEWFCPACKSRVILKVGKIKRPHFAHYSKQDCDSFSENESEEHLLGKIQIANWCAKQKIQYEVEAYLPELNQRPDVLIEGKWAIEFQCSPLSLQRLIERTENYLQNGYVVIWLLGKKLHIQTKLTAIHRVVMTYSRKLGVMLYEYNVQQNQVILCYHIEEISWLKSVYVKRYRWRLIETVTRWFEDRYFPHIFSIRYYEIEETVFKQRAYITQRLYYQENRTIQIQGLLYQNGLTLQKLEHQYMLEVRELMCSSKMFIELKLAFWIWMNQHTQQFNMETVLHFFNEWYSTNIHAKRDMPFFSHYEYTLDMFYCYLNELYNNHYLGVNHSSASFKTMSDVSATDKMSCQKSDQKLSHQISAYPIKNMLE